MNVGDLIVSAVRTLRAAPALFLGLPVLVGLALAIPGVALFAAALAAGLASKDPGAALGLVVLAAIAFALVAVYVILRLTGALVTAAYRVSLGERPTLAQAWREGRFVVWPMVALVLLLAAGWMAFWIVLILVIVALMAADSSTGAVVLALMILALVPVLYWLSVRLIYIFPAIAIERAGPVDAIRRSLALTRGSWWMTFGRILMLALLALPVFVVVSLLTAPFQAAVESENAGAQVAFGVGAAISGVISIILNFVMQVFSYIYTTLMYVDARRREMAAGAPQDRPWAPSPAEATGSGYPYGTAAPGYDSGLSRPYGGQVPYGSPVPGSSGQPYPPGATQPPNTIQAPAQPYPPPPPPPPTSQG